jgi:tRNA threonylcarbamoyladenosine biosynthesis protein TsaB
LVFEDKDSNMLLAIDTATHLAGLALYDEAAGWILGEEMWQSANNHTVELMPRLVRLMEQQRMAPADLSGLAVSLGPGSFTGLRIGLSLAKGLSLALDLPLVGIPTLDIVARPHMVQHCPIWAILQAGRGRICAGQYVRRKGRWRRQGDYQLTTLEKLCNELEGNVLICGEIRNRDMEMLSQRLGSQATIASPAASLRRPAYLAELGWERLGRGDLDDPRSLSPIYLQNPQIDA